MGNVESERETERASSIDERSQGDIIRLEYFDGEGSPGLGVVINADCDLAHQRLDGVITYLPIYSFKDYLSQFWAPGHVRTIEEAATRAVLDLLGDSVGDGPSLHAWILSSGHHAVAETLSKVEGVRKAQIPQLTRDIARLAVTLEREKPSYERFSALCQAEPEPSAHARKQILAAKKAMGDGHFFISELVDHDGIGFVIRMRRIYSIPEELCFRTFAEQQASSGANDTTAVRIGRLTPLYRFKVLQLFAQQFSRVGLPDHVTALSDLAIDDLVAAIA